MNSAITLRKILDSIMAFWQLWQSKNVAPSLPGTTDLDNPQSPPWGIDPQRLPFDPLDCEELGVFALDQPADRASAGAGMPLMAAVPMNTAAPKKPARPPFRPGRNLGTPGRREGAGTH